MTPPRSPASRRVARAAVREAQPRTGRLQTAVQLSARGESPMLVYVLEYSIV